MLRVIFIIAVVGGILAAPLLCDAGVTEHECMCESTDACCADENSCEPDPCDDVFNQDRRQHDPAADVFVGPLPMRAIVSPASEIAPLSAVLPLRSSEALAATNLPLLI